MKVVHISTFAHGGAGLCAKRINSALIDAGVDSQMLIASGQEEDGITVATKDKKIWYRSTVLGKLKHILMRLAIIKDAEYMSNYLVQISRREKYNVFVSHHLSFYKNIVNHPLVKEADIIHLHWVANFVDYPSFFNHIDKPIVWTLHDRNPLMGIFFWGITRKCAPISMKTIDTQFQELKCKCINKCNNIRMVAISSFMKECIDNTFGGTYETVRINNGVDVDVFSPHDKNTSRCELLGKYGVSIKDKVLLFSSYFMNEKNKGLARVVKALEEIAYEKVTLVCVGRIDNEEIIHSNKIKIIYTGLINDNVVMSKLYSASDCFISASVEESFSQTTIEAMSCGIPVVGTPTGIIPDVVRPFNGVVCKGFESSDIAMAIKKMLYRTYDSTMIRNYILAYYSYDIVANQYISLYKTIIKNGCS